MLSRGGGIGGLVGLTSEPGTPGVGLMPLRTAMPAWYDVTWNPTAGCSAVSPGCDHCEAMRTVAQLARMGGKAGARYAGLTTMGRTGAQWNGELRVRDDVLTWPLVQRKGRRILVNSLSDLFHEKLATDTIDAVHAVMTIAHWHRFLMLTRRAERMRVYYADPQTPRRIATQIEHLAETVLPALGPSLHGRGSRASAGHASELGVRRNWDAGLARVIRQPASLVAGEAGAATIDPWPLPNLWPGVAVEDQARAGRIGELLRTPAARRWVCFEPLLGPVRPDLVPIDDDGYADALAGSRFDLDGRGRRLAIAGAAAWPLDWVIVGGEIGVGARPTNVDWVRDLRDRCVAAGVPFFFKQWGEWAPAPDGDAAQKVVYRGRRTAGRRLDGRSWDEIPSAMQAPTSRPR
jgi:protein gp37